MAYLLFQSRRERGHFSTLKFDPIFNDLLNLVETDQMAYVSFQQVEKGVNFQRWNVTLYLIMYLTYRTITVKNGEMAYLSFQ